MTREINVQSGYVYRETLEQDVLGNVTEAELTNGLLEANATYSVSSGQMLDNQVSRGMQKLHHLSYVNYDAYGNLKHFENLSPNVGYSEVYEYDELHRLTRNTISSNGNTASINYAYDAVGNFLYKSDYSTSANNAYRYASGTNRLTSVLLKNNSTATFGYDNKGNQTHRNGNEEFIYNVFNKPTKISRLGAVVDLHYDANWQRYKQVKTASNKTVTTLYIDKMFEVEFDGGDTITRSYIGDIAIIEEKNNRAKSIQFTHKDRLGSSVTFTDHNGQVTAYRSYDPFGKPKMGNGALMSSLNLPARLANNSFDSSQNSNRGFTDHEHLDDVEIIHMNGRVYDYNLGRFMSVDPFIQGVGNSQGINPYSYVLNNPLGFVDPSGYKAETTKTGYRKRQRSTGTKLGGMVTTTTFTTTNEAGNVVNETSIVQDGNSTSIGSVSYDNNGAITQVVGIYQNHNTGESGGAFYDKNSQTETTNSTTPTNETIEQRSVSATDSDGNVFSFNSQRMYAGSPESLFGAMHGAHNSGAGYDAWVAAGGSSSALDHPLVQMGMAFIPVHWIGKGLTWTKGLVLFRTGNSVTKNTISISSQQLGKKLGKHVSDFGGNPSNAADRAKVIDRINDIANHPDKIVMGTFKGQGFQNSRGFVNFRIKGNDVVVTKPDGTFVTVMKDGINNTSVKNALSGNY